MKSSQISGFYKLSPRERLNIVKEFAGLNDEEVELIYSMSGLKLDLANHMLYFIIYLRFRNDLFFIVNKDKE